MIEKVDRVEAYTIKAFLLYGFLNGIMNGGFSLIDIIARKTLLASNLIITLLSMIWPVANLFSIFWGYYIEGREDRKLLFIITAFLGRLSILLIFFINSPLPYLLLFVLFFSFNAFIIPVQNTILQSNIGEERRSFIFGLYISISGLFTLITSIFFGKLLDYNQMFYKPIIAVCGIAGFFAVIVLSRIKLRKVMPRTLGREKGMKPLLPIFAMLNIFKKDRDFFIYELAYFIYGTAFLMVLPVIPHFLVNKLGMTYSQISFAKVFLAQSIVVILAPFAGKFHDRINPAMFCFFAYLILAFYPSTIALSGIFHISAHYLFVYLGFIIFSLGMAGINISWSMGTIYFSRDIDAGMLQSIHVSLTGVRGLIAPFIGYAIMTIYGDEPAFFTASLLFLIASLIMHSLGEKIEKDKKTQK